MKATGAILTGWPLFYLDTGALSTKENTNGSRPTSSRSLLHVRSHIAPGLRNVQQRTRINLSKTSYMSKALMCNLNARKDN